MSSVKIGVVEDDKVMSGIICVLLKNLGYQVLEPAKCYLSALKMIEQHTPDVLLLDINLGESKDGIEVAKFVREKNSIPIIFLTSFALESTVEKAKLVNPDAFLLKPFTKDDLYSTIEITLNNFKNYHNHSNIKQQESLLIKDGYNYIKISLNEIIYLSSDHNYVTFHLLNNKKTMMRSTLHDMLDKLPPSFFLRLNRSYIINLKHVTRLDTDKVLVNDIEFIITKPIHDIILEKLNTLL